MRHRKLVDQRGEVDTERGAAGGRPPVWRVDAAPELDIVERELGAARVLGLAHRGPLAFADLQALCRKVEDAARAAGARTEGPVFTVLRANPYEVAPSRRSFFTCVRVVGPVTAPEGMSVEALQGGLFLVAAKAGPLRDLDKAFGFLFGKLLAARGHELARPDAPEIRLLFPTPPPGVAKEANLVTEIAIPVVITMRNDSMRNQR